MKKVGIVMGSDSDLPIVKKATDTLTALEIPGTVRSIQAHAFRGCTGLISVTIDEGCEEIGTSAFEGCENLRELTLPESIEIEVDAFRGCDLLNR